MQKTRCAGIILIVAALMEVLVMSLHPHGDEMASNSGAILMNTIVHSVAILIFPLLFLGLLSLVRKTGQSGCGLAAVVAFAIAGVSVINAAIASGFVESRIFEEMATASESQMEGWRLQSEVTHFWNQGFAAVFVVASGISLVLMSIDLLKQEERKMRCPGFLGLLVGGIGTLLFLFGHIQLDIHGLRAIVLGQALWFAWLGVLFFRADPAQ